MPVDMVANIGAFLFQNWMNDHQWENDVTAMRFYYIANLVWYISSTVFVYGLYHMFIVLSITEDLQHSITKSLLKSKQSSESEFLLRSMSIASFAQSAVYSSYVEVVDNEDSSSGAIQETSGFNLRDKFSSY